MTQDAIADRELALVTSGNTVRFTDGTADNDGMDMVPNACH